MTDVDHPESSRNGRFDSVFVRRRGRITRGQARALAEGRAACEIASPEDIHAAFPRHAPLLIEVGFGMGQTLLDFAVKHPEWDCLGIEVYQPGIGALLLGAETAGLENIRFIEADATRVLAAVPVASATRIHVLFPDPWPKKRHHKRRLVQAPFVADCARSLCRDGRLRIATDWQPYAEHIAAVLESEALLENESNSRFAARDARVETRFEARGRRLGHDVWDFAYRRRS